MDMVIERFQVHLVNLDPTVGSEIEKVRPCMIISPNEMNQHLNTVIIAPLTSTIRNYPTRINCSFQQKQGQLVLDQIRTIDKQRLVKLVGDMDERTGHAALSLLR